MRKNKISPQATREEHDKSHRPRGKNMISPLIAGEDHDKSRGALEKLPLSATSKAHGTIIFYGKVEEGINYQDMKKHYDIFIAEILARF